MIWAAVTAQREELAAHHLVQQRVVRPRLEDLQFFPCGRSQAEPGGAREEPRRLRELVWPRHDRRHGGPGAGSFERQLLEDASREERPIDRGTGQDRHAHAARVAEPDRLEQRRRSRDVRDLHVLEVEP